MRHSFLVRLLGTFGLACTLWSAAGLAKVERITVSAEVAEKETRAATLEAAKREARRRAVEQGAGTLVQSNTIVRNFQMIADEIVTSARGVLSDEEWGELEVGEGTAKITLTATVSQEALESSICTVVKANHDPRIALVMVEKSGKEDADWKVERGMVEVLVTDRLINSCFTLVEPGVKVTEVSAAGDIPLETISKIAENTQAQYILIGAGKLLDSGSMRDDFAKTGFRSYSLSIALRLFNIDTRTIEAVGEGSMQMAGVSAQHALKGNREKSYAVIDGALDKLVQKITARWSQELVAGSQVQVVVRNLKNMAAANKFQGVSERLFPAGKIRRNTLKNKQAVFTVEVEGGADVFASEIEGKKVDKLSVEVLEVSRGQVVLELK